jgi:MFS superfamily sulfate permease-like transporter
MKQSEIQEIISSTPDAVFNSNKKYNGYFIITGFVKEPTSTHGTKTMVYALTKQLYFNTAEGITRISDFTETKPLRTITGVFSNSIDSYNAHNIEMSHRIANAKIVKEQNENAMNDLKPKLQHLLKDLNIENKERNFGTTTTFKIELDVDNATALLSLLFTIAMEQVNN